jgi:hypothetical protein
MKNILIFMMNISFLLSSVNVFGASLTAQGAAELAAESHPQTEAAVESGRTERDINTIRPLVPVYKAVEEALEYARTHPESGGAIPTEGEESAAGYSAVLSCSNGFVIGVSQDTASQKCDGGESKDSCLKRFETSMNDKYGGLMSICSKVNKSGYEYGDSFYLRRD